MMELLGLHDDYAPDGRVLSEIFTAVALPGRDAREPALLALGRVYTQIEAPVGAFGLDTLKASTRALASRTLATPPTRGSSSSSSSSVTSGTPSGAACGPCCWRAFGGQPVDPGQAAGLIRQCEQLIGQAAVLARSPCWPGDRTGLLGCADCRNARACADDHGQTEGTADRPVPHEQLSQPPCGSAEAGLSAPQSCR